MIGEAKDGEKEYTMDMDSPLISITKKLKKLFILKISQDHGINALLTIPLPTDNHGLITFNLRHPYGSIQF